MLIQQIDEPLAMGWLDQMQHLMHHDVFQQVLWLLDQFRVQTDRAGSVITAPPLGLQSFI